MNFLCTATFMFPPPTPVVCGMANPGIIVSISGDLSSGIYWDLNSDTNNHPFTNPGAFALQVGDAICVNGSGEVVSFTTCDIESQFFIDTSTNPITNKFPGCNLTAPLAQFFASANLINPNATITVTDVGVAGLEAVVTIRDNTSHTIAGLQVFSNDIPVFIFETPFTCSIVKRNRGIYQSIICIPPNGYSTCPMFIRHELNNQIYKFIGKDSKGNCCYKLFRRR